MTPETWTTAEFITGYLAALITLTALIAVSEGIRRYRNAKPSNRHTTPRRHRKHHRRDHTHNRRRRTTRRNP